MWSRPGEFEVVGCPSHPVTNQKVMSASRVRSGIISFIIKISECLWPRVSHHYNFHEKVQRVGVSPNGMHVYKLPSKVLFGEHLPDFDTYES